LTEPVETEAASSPDVTDKSPSLRTQGGTEKMSGETPHLFLKKKDLKKDKPSKPVIQEKKKEPFDIDQLMKAWTEYQENRIMTVQNDAENLIFSHTPQIQEDDSLLLTLRSELEISIIQKFEDELVQFLRQKLHNDHIRIHKEVEDNQVAKKLYTGQDKYNYMIEQNPALKRLKEKLGLDFEF